MALAERAAVLLSQEIRKLLFGLRRGPMIRISLSCPEEGPPPNFLEELSHRPDADFRPCVTLAASGSFWMMIVGVHEASRTSSVDVNCHNRGLLMIGSIPRNDSRTFEFSPSAQLAPRVGRSRSLLRPPRFPHNPSLCVGVVPT